jgi:hypothetical protein
MGKQSRRNRQRQEGTPRQKVTPRQEFQRYDVFYPSGLWYTATGTFRLVPLDDMLCPTIELRDGQILIPDQRAILLTEERRVVYEPARNRDGLHRAIRLWLEDHPGWVAAAFLNDPSRRPRSVAG